MNDFILHDRYFDPDAGRLSAYFSQLFILLGPASVSYSILDTEKNMFIGLADYRLEGIQKSPDRYYNALEKLFSGDSHLLKKYPSVIVGVGSKRNTLVPAPLFETERLKEFLLFNFRIDHEFEARADRIETIDTFNVYEADSTIEEIIRKYAAESLIVHRSTGLLRSVEQIYSQPPGHECIFLNIRENHIDLVFFREKRLVFYNSFLYSSKEDILYFTLYTCEQLGLRPENLGIIVSGLLEMDSETGKMLGQYIQAVSVSEPIQRFSFHSILKQAPLHRYHELFALALCGS
jgi:hypothetical protein